MAIDAVPEARSYIVNRNGKGKSNGKGLAWRKLKRQNTTTGKMFLPKDTGVVHSYMF